MRFLFLKKAEQLLRHPEDLFSTLSAALKKAYDKRGVLFQVFEDFLALFRLVKAWVLGDYTEAPQKVILWSIFAIVYFLSPVDAIPDILPGGYLDDIFVIRWIIGKFGHDIDKFKAWEKIQKH